MAITTASIFTVAQATYPDLSQTLFLTLLNDVFQDLSIDIPLVQDTAVDISLTSGVQEYSLADPTFHVYEADYQSATSTFSTISPTTKDQLDERFAGWRNNTTLGIPEYWYQHGGYVGFYPTPNVTTSGGIPQVVLYVSAQAQVLGISDSLPSPVRTMEAFLFGTLYRFALILHREDAQLWQELYQEHEGNLMAYMGSRSSRLKGGGHPQPKGGS